MNNTQEINTAFSNAANKAWNEPHDTTITLRKRAPGILGWLGLRWITYTETYHYDPETDHPFLAKSNILNNIRSSR